MTRRNITADFKFKVILEALKERKTLEELGTEFKVWVWELPLKSYSTLIILFYNFIKTLP